jgi:ubiquinone/menaquinone biosynthesis C-methylase UbiE
MTLLNSFPWPSPPGSSIKPQWNGRHFTLGGQASRVLAYNAETSHWSDDLTSLHEAEAGRDHPIDLASRRLAVSSMGRLHASAPIILDVGCSSGFVLEDLRQTVPHAGLIGADYLRGPLEGLAQRMPDIPILQFDLRKCPLPGACVDGVSCLNVLEHIDAHETALAEIYRILRPGGIAHIEVPAGPALYDIYDEHLMHHRRYCLNDLVSLASKIGFQVDKATHLGFAVFPAFWWVKSRNRKKLTRPAEEKTRLVAAQIRATRVNPLFAALIRLETAVGRRLSYPWGIRCVSVLRKC